MTDTPILGLPEIDEGVESQAALHNTALRKLESRSVRVLSRTVTGPPGSPAESDSYIVPTGSPNTWGGSPNDIAMFIGGAWDYFTPVEGIRVWVNDSDTEYAFDGAAWVSGALSSFTPDDDGTLAANSDSRFATQKATKTYVDNSVTGLWDVKGATNCSANPNYPAALKGDAYVVSVAGKIGGVSGTSVDVGDVYVALLDNAGGTEASVGTSWMHLEHNLIDTVKGPSSAVDRHLAIFDGATGKLIADGGPAYWEVGGGCEIAPTSSLMIGRFPITRAIEIPVSMTGSQGVAEVAATAQTDFDVTKNGASFGTMRFAIGATVATFISAGGASLVAGDVVRVVAPATPDATLSQISFVLVGTRVL